jgi:hypothetical protein
MKKTLITNIFLSALASTALTANASDVSSYLNKKTDKAFDSIIQEAYKSDSGRDEVYKDIQASVSPESSPQAVSSANELLINVTSMIFPQFAGYWDNVATWSNVPVYQNHDLYDMERQSLPRDIHMSTQKVNLRDHSGNFAFVDGSKISTTPYGSTEFLMTRGYPGIGPDGMPIQLCRFFTSKYAPYVEISYSDAKALYPLIHGAGYSASCLSASLSYDYWKSRKQDFFNNFGDAIRPQNTIQHF